MFSFFLADGAAAAGAGSPILTIVMIVGLLALMYFFMIRPQKKQEKQINEMRENLQVGDEIVTIGGIYGRVVSLKEDTIVIESKSDHSKLTIARWALQTNLTVHDVVEEKPVKEKKVKEKKEKKSKDTTKLNGTEM